MYNATRGYSLEVKVFGLAAAKVRDWLLQSSAVRKQVWQMGGQPGAEIGAGDLHDALRITLTERLHTRIILAHCSYRVIYYTSILTNSIALMCNDQELQN